MHRDVPPISGRIAWARQLTRRIRNPMDIFQKHPSCLKTPEAAKIIRNFNQLATVLVEFEILYHNGWLKQVEVAKTGTIASRVRVNFSLLTEVSHGKRKVRGKIDICRPPICFVSSMY